MATKIKEFVLWDGTKSYEMSIGSEMMANIRFYGTGGTADLLTTNDIIDSDGTDNRVWTRRFLLNMEGLSTVKSVSNAGCYVTQIGDVRAIKIDESTISGFDKILISTY